MLSHLIFCSKVQAGRGTKTLHNRSGSVDHRGWKTKEASETEMNGDSEPSDGDQDEDSKRKMSLTKLKRQEI